MAKRSAGILLFRRDDRASRCCSSIRAARSGPRRTSAPGRSRRASTRRPRRRSRPALREFEEETGTAREGELDDLGTVRQKSGKVVQAWALEGDLDADAIRSNTFTMQWPPRSGRRANSRRSTAPRGSASRGARAHPTPHRPRSWTGWSASSTSESGVAHATTARAYRLYETGWRPTCSTSTCRPSPERVACASCGAGCAEWDRRRPGRHRRGRVRGRDECRRARLP